MEDKYTKQEDIGNKHEPDDIFFHKRVLEINDFSYRFLFKDV